MDRDRIIRDFTTHPGWGTLKTEVARLLAKERDRLILESSQSALPEIRFVSGRLDGFRSVIKLFAELETVGRNEGA